MFGEIGRTGLEEVMANFKILSWYLFGGPGEKLDNHCEDSGLCGTYDSEDKIKCHCYIKFYFLVVISKKFAIHDFKIIRMSFHVKITIGKLP